MDQSTVDRLVVCWREVGLLLGLTRGQLIHIGATCLGDDRRAALTLIGALPALDAAALARLPNAIKRAGKNNASVPPEDLPPPYTQ